MIKTRQETITAEMRIEAQAKCIAEHCMQIEALERAVETLLLEREMQDRPGSNLYEVTKRVMALEKQEEERQPRESRTGQTILEMKVRILKLENELKESFIHRTALKERVTLLEEQAQERAEKVRIAEEKKRADIEAMQKWEAETMNMTTKQVVAHAEARKAQDDIIKMMDKQAMEARRNGAMYDEHLTIQQITIGPVGTPGVVGSGVKGPSPKTTVMIYDEKGTPTGWNIGHFDENYRFHIEKFVPYKDGMKGPED